MKEWIKKFCEEVVNNWPLHTMMYEAQITRVMFNASHEIQDEETNHLNKEK